MLKCILIDDELPALGYLQALCRSNIYIEVVKSFNDPMKFLQQMDTLDFDLCILDINMPRISGLEIAKKLEGKAVIFSTAYKEYAADAFDMNAVDYIRKPYQAERLDQAVEKAIKWIDQQVSFTNAFLELNTSIGRTKITHQSITHIVVAENDRRDKEIFLKDSSYLLAKNITFEDLLKLLPKDIFCRINRRTIVNVDSVISHTHQSVSCQMDNEKSLISFTLSDQYRSTFMTLWRP